MLPLAPLHAMLLMPLSRRRFFYLISSRCHAVSLPMPDYARCRYFHARFSLYYQQRRFIAAIGYATPILPPPGATQLSFAAAALISRALYFLITLLFTLAATICFSFSPLPHYAMMPLLMPAITLLPLFCHYYDIDVVFHYCRLLRRRQLSLFRCRRLLFRLSFFFFDA